jgi:cytoskeletal protein RodZ
MLMPLLVQLYILLMISLIWLGVFLLFTTKTANPATSPDEVLPSYQKAVEGQIPPAYSSPSMQTRLHTITVI